MSDVIKLNSKNRKIKARILGNDAAEMASQTEQEEDLFKKELEKYYKKGLQDGYDSAKNELEKEYTDQLVQKSEQFYNILYSFEEKLLSYDEAFKNIVINVSYKIAGKIVQKEIKRDSAIENSLQSAIPKILGANEATIKLNPKDYEKLQSDNTDEQLSDKFTKIKFDPSEAISQGGCLIETEIGKVDARIESQLNEILKSLQNNLLSDEEEE